MNQHFLFGVLLLDLHQVYFAGRSSQRAVGVFNGLILADLLIVRRGHIPGAKVLNRHWPVPNGLPTLSYTCLSRHQLARTYFLGDQSLKSLGLLLHASFHFFDLNLVEEFFGPWVPDHAVRTLLTFDPL